MLSWSQPIKLIVGNIFNRVALGVFHLCWPLLSFHFRHSFEGWSEPHRAPLGDAFWSLYQLRVGTHTITFCTDTSEQHLGLLLRTLYNTQLKQQNSQLTLEDCTNDLTSRACCRTPIAAIALRKHCNNSTSHHLRDILRPQLAVLVTVTCPLLSAWVRNSSSVNSLYINIYWAHLKILKCNHKFPDQNRDLGLFFILLA